MTAPYSVSIDRDAARQYTEKGATILLLDVPEQTHVAFDHQSFVVGPKFKGVKMLPPGTHMVSYNAASPTGDFSPTTSFFVHLSSSQVYIRLWNSEQELLLDIPADEAGAFTAGVRQFDFDQNLAPYNLHAYQQWQSLSSYISKQTISKLSPLPAGNISITAEADPALLKPVTPAEKKLYAQLQEGCAEAEQSGAAAMQVDGAQLGQSTASDRQQDGHSMPGPGLKPQEGVGRCYYTQMPRLVKVPGMSPQQLTAVNLDKTGMLDQILQQHFSCHSDELLGELQFSFLAFFMGHSLEGFAQWKAIVHLLLGCEKAPLQTHVHFFINALHCLLFQLQHSLSQEPMLDPTASAEGASQATAAAAAASGPLGMASMVEEFLADSFLHQLFAKFFGMLHEEASVVNRQLQTVSKQVQQLLEQRLGWDFDVQGFGQDDEEDEYAPVIVQLDDVTL